MRMTSLRTTSRALRTGLVTGTAVAALGLGAASGALAAVHPGTGATAAASQRTYVRTVALAARGYSATVYKLGAHVYQAEVSGNGHKGAVLVARGKAAAADLPGVHVALSANGEVTSRRTTPAPAPTSKPSRKSAGSSDSATTSDGPSQATDQGYDDGDIVGLPSLPGATGPDTAPPTPVD